MSAHYPSDRTDSDRDRGLLPSVNIERTQVTIDGITLPGTWIEDRSVIVQPGEEGRQFNRVTLTLLAGDVTVGDGAVNRVQVDVHDTPRFARIHGQGPDIDDPTVFDANPYSGQEMAK